MSYGKFLEDWSKKYLRNTDKNFPEQTTEEQWAVIRNNWIYEKRYKELIASIIENWDSGNCDDFSRPFSKHLIDNNEIALFKQLWKGIIRNRLEKLWRDVEYQRKNYPNIAIERVINTDIKNYNQFSSNESLERTLAWRRLYIIDGINEFITGLKILDDHKEIEKQTALLKVVSSLEKPKPKPTTDKRKIDEDLFWQLIDQARTISTDQFNFIDNLKSTLEAFNPKELRNFDKILYTKANELKSWEHWALAYIVRRGCGDDEFDYFRVWAVSKGRNAFQAIRELNESQLLPIFDEDPQLEEFLYLAEEVYEEKTSDLMQPVKVKASILTGKRWDEGKLTQTFPTLCQLFNYD